MLCTCSNGARERPSEHQMIICSAKPYNQRLTTLSTYQHLTPVQRRHHRYAKEGFGEAETAKYVHFFARSQTPRTVVRGGWELGGCVNQARVSPRSWLDCCLGCQGTLDSLVCSNMNCMKSLICICRIWHGSGSSLVCNTSYTYRQVHHLHADYSIKVGFLLYSK